MMNLAGVLANPDFVSQFLCTRQTQSVDNGGLATNAPSYQVFYGVVAGAPGLSLKREAEGARIAGSIQIFTTFCLRDGRSGSDADLVTWCGRQYTVVRVQDYTAYGFVAADLDLVPIGG